MDNDIFKILHEFTMQTELSAYTLSAIVRENINTCVKSIQYLNEKKWIKEVSLSGQTADSFYKKYKITFDGTLAYKYERKKRRLAIFEDARAWITLLIAIAAFIKSFFG